LTGEPLTGVLAYFLLVVTELCASVGFDDDLEIRENDIPEIDVVFDRDRELGNDATRVQAFDDPQNCGLENVVATSVRCLNDRVSALITRMLCVSV